MDGYRISMPHRHTVRYEENNVILEFEVELTADGIIFYSGSPKVISGISGPFFREADVVSDWLKARFGNVEIDGTRLP